MTIEVSPTGKVARLGAHHRWTIGAAGVVAVVLTALIVLMKPSAPRGWENGSFLNDCCGGLTLHDGEMALNGKPATRYTIGRDAGGFYVLPRFYVGGMDNLGFEIDGSRPAAKLRLDRLPDPQEVQVPGARETFLFERRPGVVP
ncbi:hypothetical protein [Sphingomonas crusticola]|uniref:hypothetical protein n=1 Tax=Sphingomonas crusticola TaxID=1697973 RepID=UPI0013C2ACAF|nr:hypothetical protein [Sphingomonas crusticola]